MMKFTLFILSFMWVTLAYAQDGTLDQTFGAEGILVHDASNGVSAGSDTGRDVIGLPDGTLLASASLRNEGITSVGVLKFLEDGTLDTTFGVEGRFIFNNLIGTDLPYEMMVDTAYNIYVCGGFALDTSTADNVSFGMLKIDSLGNLDTDFGVDGFFSVQIDSSQDYARDMYVDSNGKFVLAGYSHTPGFNTKSNVLIRVNTNGTLDETFGDEGKFTWQSEDLNNELYAILLDDNDDIYTSGYSKISGGEIPVIYKVLADGSAFDTTFGTDGEFFPAIEGRCTSMIWGADGNIIGTGKASGAGGASDALIFNLLTSGTLNPDFGNRDGYSVQSIQPISWMHEVIQQPDGKFVCGGEASAGFRGPKGFGTVRFLENGEVDLTWGELGNGTITTPTGTFISFANGLVMQPNDGKIVVVGTSNGATVNDLTLVRYNNNIDADGDGVDFFSDCDDNDPDVYRTGSFYLDADGDGYSGSFDEICYGDELPDGYVEEVNGRDCDDTNAEIYRVARLFIDMDGDGYDNGASITCYGDDIPDGFAENTEGPDCDDTDADKYREAKFFIDADGDGYTLGDEFVCYGDEEVPDGYASETSGEDCDDNDGTVYRQEKLFIDVDGDGYDNGDFTVCYGDEVPDGYAAETLGEDCDDENADINPGAEEIPNNGIDEDCDGEDLVAVKETAFSNTFSVYPNPVGDYFILSNESDATVQSITIFNNVGQILSVQTSGFGQTQTRINSTDLPNGLLVVEINTSNGLVVKQLIKR